MVKYSLLFLVVLACVAYVISAPAPEEENVDLEGDVEDVQPSETRKIKRGIYSGFGHGYGHGYGYGHYPYYTYSYAPIYKSYGYGGFGHGYDHYPYSLGLHGYGHGHGGYYW